MDHAAGRSRALATALVQACHPAPTVAVTLFATVLALRAGNRPGTVVLIAVAVLAGQLSIGWTNDRLDAARDTRAGRTDKPVVTGALPIRVLDSAASAAVVATLGLSALLGWRAGLANLWVLAWGLLYNLGLKATWWSWLPYAAAFGALPAVATLALGDPAVPAAWVVLAGALLGVAANLTNALPDLADDEDTGVRGLPHRLGAARSLFLAAALLVVVTAAVVFGPPGRPAAFGWIALVVVVGLVAGGLGWALGHPADRRSFLAIMAVTALDLVVLSVTADRLT